MLAGIPMVVVLIASHVRLSLGRGDVEPDLDPACVAVLARLAEGLQQTLPNALARHLNQPQAGDLCHLMFGPVAPEAFHQAANHQIAIRLKHHVDEVDHDDAADVPQSELARHFDRGLHVDRKSTRLNSSHIPLSRMPSSA